MPLKVYTIWVRPKGCSELWSRHQGGITDPKEAAAVVQELLETLSSDKVVHTPITGVCVLPADQDP